MTKLLKMAFILLLCASASAVAQQSSAQHELTVVVVNAHADPAQPVQGVRVSLSYVSGSEKVVESRDATNRAGQALLVVSSSASQRGDLRIEVSGVTELVVFEPADGQLNGLPATVTLKLLPKGSPALLGPAQIEAMLRRLSLQVKHLEQQNREAKVELAGAGTPKPDDLTASIAEWAKANGIAAADADNQVHQWAAEIQQRKDLATADQKALAELALKHYGAAAQLFDKATADIGESMDDDDKKFLEERRKKLRDLVDKAFQSSNAYQLNLQYRQATQILEQAQLRAAAEHGRYPADAALRSIWLDSLSRCALARREEGEIASGASASQLISRSIADYRNILREYSAADSRQGRAVAEDDLGIALRDQGLRSGGPEATGMLVEAVEAFRSALQVLTKADSPQDWARTQVILGLALNDQASRSSGAQATELTAQAVRAYQAGLEVYTKVDTPQDWAAVEVNLGNVLAEQSYQTTGAQAMNSLAQAVKAYRAALEVDTKADNPRSWAELQNNLGGALADEGAQSNDAQATDFLAQAVQADQAALEVDTKADLPQDWARIQNNLGIALTSQAFHSSGAQAKGLLAQAEQAYRAALEVRTREDLPQDWATTQNNLGNCLIRQGEQGTGPAADALLARAVVAFRAALEVQTKTELPQDWAMTQNSLGVALTDEGALRHGPAAVDLFAQAAVAFRAVLEVATKADLPQNWAMTTRNLANVLLRQGEQSSGAQETELLAQAVQAYRAAMQVYTKAEMPDYWASTEVALGNALVDQGDLAGASTALDSAINAVPADVNVLAGAITVYHGKLFQYDRAYDLTQRWVKLDPSPISNISLVEAGLTSGHFEECAQHAATIGDSTLPAPTAPFALVRDSMKMACQWGAGKPADAEQTLNALLLNSGQLQKSGVSFPGTSHFLATSPAFQVGRASWLAVFDSLAKGDGGDLAAALQKLQGAMKP